MADYVAFVDESGCKLKAGTMPQDGSDLGVAVAVVLPQTALESFVTAIRDRLPLPLTENSHVTDWDADSQRAAREAVFSIVKDQCPPILYEAITAEGFHRSQHLVPEEAKRQAKAGLRSPVKVSDSHDNPQSHADLLANVMSKVRALVSDLATEEDRAPTAEHVAFLIDQVDGPILEEAKALMAEIDSAGDPHVVRVKGFDTEKKTVVEGAIVSSIQGLDDLPLPQYSVDVRPKTDLGIFAADVIANALYKHLRDLVATKGRQARLNQPAAVEGFALRDHVAGFSDLDASDILYGFGEHTNRSEGATP